MADPLVVAKAGDTELAILPAMSNRHGLITGATGTGKTISLQVLAEHFSRIGVPTFMADVKGDLTGIAFPGSLSPKLEDRLDKLGLPEPTWGGRRSRCGTSGASRATRSAPRSRTWGRSCSPACST